MADKQDPAGNGTFMGATERLKNRSGAELERMESRSFENPLQRLTRLSKENPERAKNLALQIRDAAPSLSAKPLSARERLKVRQLKDKQR